MGRIEHAVDAQLDDAFGDDIDQGVAEEMRALSAEEKRELADLARAELGMDVIQAA